MINNYDKIFNKVSKLNKSKWTSLKKIKNYKHYEVINVNHKGNQVELFAVCDKETRVTVKIRELKDKNLWKRGWEPSENNNTLINQIIDSSISEKDAICKIRQIV